jgi:YD repeat-containing protein
VLAYWERTMGLVVRRLAVCWMCCVGLVFGCVSVSSASTPIGGGSAFGVGLVVPAEQLLDGGEEVRAAEEARRASSQAFVTREVSQTAYSQLSAVQARKLDAEAFPGLVGEPSGGPPAVPIGEKIVGYPADNVAQLVLPGSKRGVIESAEPIALETSRGHRSPIDLRPRESGRTFQPAVSAVQLKIPKRLGAGIGLGRAGVSLTPVDSTGVPLGGSEGEVDGATVMYANSVRDGDTLVKPTTFGFSAETLLRSADSPRQLYFRVGLPEGARLVSSKNGSGVAVVADGRTLARFVAPEAHDAEGTPVPVTMTVSGNNLIVTVAPFAGIYRLPIAVDPTAEDSIWQNEYYYSTYYRTNWTFERGPYPEGIHFTAPEHPEGGRWTEYINYSHTASEWGGLFYTTRGESQITLAHAEGGWNDLSAKIQNYMVLYVPKSPYLEDYDPLPEYTELERGGGGYACAPALNCPETTAGTAPPENNNTAAYEQESTGSGAIREGINWITRAYVEISQEKSPTIEFNKTSATLENVRTGESVPNVLYGSGEWLGPHHGGFEVPATDPGIGISEYRVEGAGMGFQRYFFAEGECAGIQCPPEYGKKEPFLYSNGMANGEDSLEAFVTDKAGLYADIYPQKIKVDGSPPRNIKVSGFQNGNELPLGETHLKVEATDGEGSTPSSGIKSITVSVDGHEGSAPAAHCSTGLPCTASTEVALAARDYSSGQHSLVVTATDNAYNVAQEEFTFRVRGASPVTVGPGSVDPSTGELTLSNTDVSLGGTAEVSRTYQSRHQTAGAEGPLGPQWAINLGAGESLTVPASGSAVLTASGGAATTFTRNSKGEFESPVGDSNLTLAAKGSSEYILSDATAGTQTKFEQPSAMRNAAPSFAGEFGHEAKLDLPVGAAVDSSGDVWVASYLNDLIEKFSATGTLLATYGSYGTQGGQYTNPWGIAINRSSGDVYVSDLADNRIEELSSAGAFIKAFGWGVSDGKDEFEICTKECKPGIAGNGNGQFNSPHGLAVDTSGDLWVADCSNNRIEEFSSSGTYVRQAGTYGSGNGQLSCPAGLAISGGNVYVADYGNDRVDEFNATGGFESKFGSEGSGLGQLNGPVNIAADTAGDLYVADLKNNRVEEFSSAGTALNTFGSHGTGGGQFETNGPQGVAISAGGVVYVTDTSDSRVEQWARATWLPTEAGGPLAPTTTTYAYGTVEEEGKPVIQPSEALAPVPANVSCAPKLERGCRALTFNYATTTTATGESESEWGDYKGHLTRVYVHAWNPSKGAMAETEVAHYLYDPRGRLRAEWDPRISPALKTTYGYDSEGHLTAITAAGQETWALTYGTLSGDSNAGRLLRATQAPATSTLWNGKAPLDTEVPTLTGSSVVGITMGVSTGTWSNNPVTYGYQWEDCKEGVEFLKKHTWECTPIAGATNPNYTAEASDEGFYLGVIVTAINGGGSVTAQSVSKGKVKANESGATEGTHYAPTAGWAIEYGVPVSGAGAPDALGAKEAEAWGQKDDPVEAAAVFPPDEPMGRPATDYKRATISYWDSQGRLVNKAVPSTASGGAIATSEYNTDNEVVRTLSADNRTAALKEGSKSAEVAKRLDTESRYSGETKAELEAEAREVTEGRRVSIEPGTELVETLGPQHKIKLAEGGSEVLARSHVRYVYDEGAPEGKHYGLVTRTTDGAEYEGKEADVRTTLTSYSGQQALGWKLRKATSTTTDPAGLDLVHVTEYNASTGAVTETNTPAATGKDEKVPPTYAAQIGTLGTENGQLKAPRAAAIAGTGNVYVMDTGNSRVEEFSASGTYLKKFGKEGTSAGEFKSPFGIAEDSKGDLWVADTGNNRVQEFNPKNEHTAEFGKVGTAAGQLKEPKAIAVTTGGSVFVVDGANNRIDKFKENGEFVLAFGYGVSNGKEEFEICTTTCQAGLIGSGNGEFNGPRGVAVSTNGIVYVADAYNKRIEEFNEKGEYVTKFGTAGTEPGQLQEPKGVTIDAANHVWVTDASNDTILEFEANGTYMDTFGSKGTGTGQLEEPWSTAITSSGNIYVADLSNNRIEKWMPTITGNPGAHDTETIYYTVKEEASVAGCRNHPEWAGLPCQVQPAAQPEVGPSLPVSSYAYNIWDEIEKTTETFGSATRIKAETYDAAGRALTSETASTTDKALPKVTNTYNEQTGALEKQSTEAEGKTQTITNKDNTLGQLIEYTDAAGNVAKYTYDIDGRVKEISEGKGEEAKSTQTYTYDTTTGDLTKLVDSGAGTFTAEYDVEGKMTTATYPNGMNAKYTYDPSGAATTLEYVKETHCTEKCTWLSDHIVQSIHGETLLQTSTLATERYTYDKADRLAETEEEPAGKPCATRLYAYDEEANRTSLTAREGSEGKCAAEGGTIQRHTYDQANRLTDNGINYETFGNTTQLPASDAGKYELSSTYYVDNQLATEKQNGETINYNYDPAGRTLETNSEGTTSSNVTSHYAGAGQASTWTSEGSGKWTRNIAGIDGALTATQTSSGTTTLQLHDLQGNIVATGSVNETETKLLSTYNSTEFGVPQPGTTPPKHAWLGASGLATEAGLSAGVANPGGTSYVPLIGRPLQTEAIAEPGAFPDGTGYAGVVQATYLQSAASSIKALAVQHAAELQEAARRQAEEEAAPPCGSECQIDGPGEGNCEANCVVPSPTEGGAEGSSPFSASLSIEEGTGAVAAYARSFVLTPGQAIGASRAVGVINKGVFENPYFPEWANQVLKNIPFVDWSKLANDLFAGGTAAAPLGAVEVTIEGTLRPKHFHLFILVKAISDYDY